MVGDARGEVPVDEALCNCRGMGPPKWQGKEGIGVQWCADADAAVIGRWEAD